MDYIESDTWADQQAERDADERQKYIDRITELEAEVVRWKGHHARENRLRVSSYEEVAALKEAAKAHIAALTKKQYSTSPPEPWPDIAPTANALAALLEGKGAVQQEQP